MANNYTIISDLAHKTDIEDSNLIIVEDNEDTKQSTILELKKSLTGDYKNPSETLFYSSQKIEEKFSSLTRELSTYASDTELKSIEKRVEDIIISSIEGEDPQVADAKDGEKTLSARLARDIKYADNKYIKKIHRVVEGKEISTGNHGYVDIYLENNANTNVLFKSKNILNIKNNTNGNGITYTDTGFNYSQINNNVEVSLKLGSSFPKGTYYFFTSKSYDALFNDRANIKLAVKNSKDDSAYTEFAYNQSVKFEFTAPKAFDEIKLIFNKEKYSSNSVAKYTNIMLTRNAQYGNTYIPYASLSVPVEKNTYLRNFYNEDYDISCSDKNANLRVEYYDNSISMESMQASIDEMKSIVVDKRDKCGLMTNYGEYLFFDNIINETPTASTLSYDNDKYMRNGTPSLKVTFNGEVKANPLFTLKTNNLPIVESVSLVFYIDRTSSYFFTTEKPITIYLCSDSYDEPDMVNYYKTEIFKEQFVQGWNNIKVPIEYFTAYGLPNAHGIRYVKIEITNNSSLDKKSIYLNSVIFNQKMKPVVLLAFDGIYEDGASYTYLYLTNKNFPATIFVNNNTTYSRTLLETIVNLRVKNGWDIGQYGCHPNKELLTYDDNPRPQYLALRTTKTWLNDNLVLNPISYSPPYGNLRPINVPILKDLGYKIAKTESSGFINFFDPSYDFALPMTLISNNMTEEEIIAKVQYAIDNDCGVCLYTNNVTEYGDESAVKKIVLENVVKFILTNSDKITPMTFSDFYNKCNS